MDTKKIQEEINKIHAAPFSKKSDKQLIAHDVLSTLHKQKYAGVQPIALVKYNKSENRKTKLSKEDIISIRGKYNPHIYGKKRLAKEFGISVSLVHKIINRLKWKDV
jgi:DNA invertase Pin-like site-specific DNA recombinase